MYVRLAVAWTDPAGVAHRAGEVVDIDAVTLAELEEQGVVEDPNSEPTNIGPGPSTDDPFGSGTDADPNIGPGPSTDDPFGDESNIGPGPSSDDAV